MINKIIDALFSMTIIIIVTACIVVFILTITGKGSEGLDVAKRAVSDPAIKVIEWNPDWNYRGLK